LTACACSWIGTVAGQGGKIAPRPIGAGRLIHVPYNGNAPAVADLVASPTSCMSDKLPSSMPHIKSRALRAIALAFERSPARPQADPARTRDRGRRHAVRPMCARSYPCPLGEHDASALRLGEAGIEALRRRQVI